MSPIRSLSAGVLASFIAVAAINVPAAAQQLGQKPNILVIWGDDIGIFNISAYKWA